MKPGCHITEHLARQQIIPKCLIDGTVKHSGKLRIEIHDNEFNTLLYIEIMDRGAGDDPALCGPNPHVLPVRRSPKNGLTDG